MKNLLTDKRFILALCVVVLIVGGFFIKHTLKVTSKKELATKVVTVGDIIELDTDKDGLPDWQEKLIGTDPFNKSTFNIPDAEYASKKRVESGAGASLYPNDGTETSRFSNEFISTISTLYQAGGLNADSAKKISDTAVDEINNRDLAAKEYGYDDLKIADNDSAQTVSLYINGLNSAFKKYPLKNDLTLQMLNKYSESEDPSELGGLEKTELLYEGLIDSILKLTVPKNAEAQDTYLLNDLSKILEIIRNLKVMDSDPIAAISAINQYERAVDHLTDSVIRMGAYAESHNFKFIPI